MIEIENVEISKYRIIDTCALPRLIDGEIDGCIE